MGIQIKGHFILSLWNYGQHDRESIDNGSKVTENENFSREINHFNSNKNNFGHSFVTTEKTYV